MMKNQTISREDVLRNFSVEYDVGKDTLLRYLTEFPEYAEDLVDLSRELAREVDDNAKLSSVDELNVESAMNRFRNALALQSEPINIAPKLFLKAANVLGLPRQVLMAFGGRKVELASIPLHFLEKLSGILEVTITQLKAFLSLPPQQPQRSYKSNVKPTASDKVSFEKILHNALVSEERIQEIMNRDE